MRLHPFLLVLELRRTSASLDHELLDRLKRMGWPLLTANQLFAFAHIDEDGTTPAELARRMGMSRQSMQKNLERLAGLGLVDVVAHPSDHRSRLVRLSDAGVQFTADAARLADGFERRLEAAFGSDAMNAARRLLSADMERVLETDQNASGR